MKDIQIQHMFMSTHFTFYMKTHVKHILHASHMQCMTISGQNVFISAHTYGFNIWEIAYTYITISRGKYICLVHI